MVATFDDPRFDALTHALRLLPSVEPSQAASYAKVERRKIDERGRVIERDDAGVADMHQLRRAVRRFRYVREALDLEAKPVKELQEELGHLNDAAVALAHLDRCPHAAELADFRAVLGDEVRHSFETAQAAWRDTDLDALED